jgi:hypothetical protein
MGDWSTSLGGWKITGFHVLFTTSLLLRFVSAGMVKMIKEPQTKTTMHVVTTLIGATPFRVLRFPVGLYRRFLQEDEDVADAAPVATAAVRPASLPQVAPEPETPPPPRTPVLRKSA